MAHSEVIHTKARALDRLQKKLSRSGIDLDVAQREAVSKAQKRMRNGGSPLFVSSWVLRLARNKTLQVHPRRHECEKCGEPTLFSVQVIDRRARWCGCD